MCDDSNSMHSQQKPQSVSLAQSVCDYGHDCEIATHKPDLITIPIPIKWQQSRTCGSVSISTCSVSSCAGTSSETSDDGEDIDLDFNPRSLSTELALDDTPIAIPVGSLQDDGYCPDRQLFESDSPYKLDIQVTIGDTVRAHSDSTCDYNDSLPTSPQTIYSSPSSLGACALAFLLSPKPHYTPQSMTAYHEFCDAILGVYCWQKPIANEAHYGPFHTSFQKEVMNNPYFKLTATDFNDIFKKCQFIRSRWIGNKIRTARCGTMGKVSWNVGEKISELELFVIKLYTDFEVCQRELKKCYRPPAKYTGNTFAWCDYEQRLCYFSHWRRLLNVAIAKYATLLKYRVFYHGINQIMKLAIHPTQQCYGPISATPDVEIARGFATKDGVILKMMSKFPRLSTDYFFNAAEISAYPDEKEILIGFMYTRILEVQLGCSELLVKDLEKKETALLNRLNCFIISSLIKHDLYSYGPYLEILFDALLMTDDAYGTDYLFCSKRYTYDGHPSNQMRSKMRYISRMIPEIVREAFKACRYNKRVLKLDQISAGMMPLFYDDSKRVLQLSKIHTFAPNISELHLYEEYEINNDFISDFLRFIKVERTSIDSIKVFKYAFDGSSDQFQCKKRLSSSHLSELQERAWYIYEDRDVNSYKCILTRKQRKIK